MIVKVLLYQSTSGKSPIEKFIRSLSKPDQARFADVYDGILKIAEKRMKDFL